LRDDLANRFSGTGGRGDNVVVDAAASTPIFVGGAVDSLLSRSRRMNGAHQAFDDPEFVVDNFCKRSETIGGAGRVRNLAM
jgi:hypothetical protein